ncbi:PREDICTED: lipase 3-like [Papilio xuthus]|uniref:Lipase n=1 Tax=Papilio xuthus TaxID=66420 RepID=A0AAJ7ECQ5_PAPXU|nr:PREDICTED: lipase 3-like [Papilio xuthus]
MWLITTSLLFILVNFVVGGRSPHADYVEQLVRANKFGSRLSNNIYEDARLDVPDLIRKYGYPVESHNVRTSDGYILQMFRIPHGRDQNNVPGVKKPVVFLMHGLLASSADWVLMGPGSAFGYLLAEEGYDVWMGNARGSTYSRRHIRLNPDSKINKSFWHFSWDEIGNIDLPAMINYALAHTGQKKLHYIGHSQGTTVFFVMGSLRPEFNNKIISMHAFGPVAYMAHNKSPLLNAISPHAESIERILSRIGTGEFLGDTSLSTWFGETFCKDGAITQPLCSNMIFLITGRNEEQFNATMLPVIMGHYPAGAAVRQLVHYGQGIVDKEFCRYDHGWMKNILRYGTTRPPRYNLGNIKIPTFLHYTYNDPLSQVEDVTRLHRELGAGVKKLVPHPLFNHIDFMWAIDARELLYDRVLQLMRSVED